MGVRRINRKEFMYLGATLGLCSVGASALAGCGGGGSPAESGETGTATDGPVAAGETTTGSDPEVGRGQAITRESEMEPNTAFFFTEAEIGQPGVLVRLENGEFAAYSAVCTHQACTVAYQPQARRLACPCHGSVFDPARGAAVETGPARVPLPQIGVEVRDGEVIRA